MNIALITDNYFPSKGGISNVMINLSEILTDLGDNVYVFNKSYHNEETLDFNVLSNANTLKGFFDHNFQFILFNFYLLFKILFRFKRFNLVNRIKLILFYCFYYKFLVRRIMSIERLVKCFKLFKIDIILSGSATFPLLYSFIISNWFNIPLVTIAHGDDFLVRYPLKMKSYILQNSNNIIATNKIMKKFIMKIHNISANKIQIINLGVNIKNSNLLESKYDLRNKFNIKKDDFIILSVSRFYPRKGFETILKAIRLIINDYPDISLKYFIIGEGEDQKKIEHLILKLNLEKIVKLVGPVNDSLKNQYYKLSDLFILVPEIKEDSIEGFGIVYIEANYFKLPVIGSDSGGVKMAIEDGKTGFLIKPKDILVLKEKILFLYNNKEICKQFGENGHKRVLEMYDWEKNVLIYRRKLKETLEKFHKNYPSFIRTK